MDKKMLEYMSTGARSPGPAAYCMKPTIGNGATDPTIEMNPAYTILGRRQKNITSIGPGPAYTTYGVFRDGRYRTPGGVLGLRLPVCCGSAQTPGPADYCIKPAKVTGGYLMRPNRSKKPSKASGPAPNHYTLPDTLDQRTAPLLGRFRARKECPTPGPYSLPDMDLHLKGRFNTGRTIGRLRSKRADCQTPGPADYDPKEQMCCNSRGKTFGRRIAKSSVFAVPSDNEFDDDCI